MKLVKFLSAFGLLLFLIWVGNTHNVFNSPVPAMGKFLSPFDGCWQHAEGAEILRPEEFRFPELGEKTKIVFDERLVPHIFAQNEEDAFFAQGFITAKYRLWQMDISSRATGGFLAEIMGERLINRDLLQRRKGLLKAADKQVKNWTQTGEIKWVEAYTKGINAYISTLSPEKYPIEFKLLGYEPTEWTTTKSALLLLAMAETLSSRNNDLKASNSMHIFGKELFDFLYPEHNPKQTPVIPSEKSYDFTPVWKDTLPADNAISQHIPKKQLFENPSEFAGSNNWAVSGDKTTTGSPILCNDPHLSLTLPSIWFEIQISTPNLNCYGVSLPGSPGIIIGFNQNIAWGITNPGHDLVDWYTINWANEEKTKYWFGDQKLDVTYREEIIEVKGQTSVKDSVKNTIWGPIPYPDNSSPHQDMAMQWIAHHTFKTDNRSQISTFVELMAAKNYEDYSRALDCFDIPPQNFVFASNEGDIAIKVNGRFPIKGDQQGRFILDGSKPDNIWKGFIPMTQVPQVKNPASNYVLSANQRSTDKSYPYYYNGGFDDYRGRMLNRVLTEMTDATPEKMQALQNNNYSIKAEEALPLMLNLLKATPQSTFAENILKDLSNWNFHFQREAKAPAIFDQWLSRIYQLTFDEIYEHADSIDLLLPDTWRLIDLLENHVDAPVFDLKNTPEIETASNIVGIAFHDLLEDLDNKYHSDSFNWQSEKGTFIGHIGRIPAFGRYDVPIGGYHDAINAVQDDFGPSWRMVVQLGEDPKAWGVFPGGQSGNPGSKYYDNMVFQWAQGGYNELFFMKDEHDTQQEILFELNLNP